MMGTIKYNHNFTIQIIHFFEKMFKLYMVLGLLAYTFCNSYISKICNRFSYYTHTHTHTNDLNFN